MSEEPPLIATEQPQLFELPESNDFQLPKFQDCEIEMVPRKAQEQIYHQRRVDEVAQSTLLRKPMLMEFGKAGVAIVLAYREQHMVESYLTKECAVYEVDINPAGEVMGFGVSLLPLDENNRPTGDPLHVHFTLTKNRFRQQGLATRRLMILNEANKMLSRNYLSSGSFASHDEGAKNTWRKLVANGFAVEDEHDSFRFVK